MGLRRIISGGQTGADQAGLSAACALGFETGGFAPRGWMTEAGPAPWLATRFGLEEHASAGYTARTRANVDVADATVIFVVRLDGGSALTVECARARHKPHLVLFRNDPRAADALRDWLARTAPETLNVAGHRESKHPGMNDWVHETLVRALAPTADREP